MWIMLVSERLCGYVGCDHMVVCPLSLVVKKDICGVILVVMTESNDRTDWAALRCVIK